MLTGPFDNRENVKIFIESLNCVVHSPNYKLFVTTTYNLLKSAGKIKGCKKGQSWILNTRPRQILIHHSKPLFIGALLYKTGFQFCSTFYQRFPKHGFTSCCTRFEDNPSMSDITSAFYSPSQPCNSFCDMWQFATFYDSFARQVWNILLQTAKFLQNISKFSLTTRNALQACNIAIFCKIIFSFFKIFFAKLKIFSFQQFWSSFRPDDHPDRAAQDCPPASPCEGGQKNR